MKFGIRLVVDLP